MQMKLEAISWINLGPRNIIIVLNNSHKWLLLLLFNLLYLFRLLLSLHSFIHCLCVGITQHSTIITKYNIFSNISSTQWIVHDHHTCEHLFVHTQTHTWAQMKSFCVIIKSHKFNKKNFQYMCIFEKREKKLQYGNFASFSNWSILFLLNTFILFYFMNKQKILFNK